MDSRDDHGGGQSNKAAAVENSDTSTMLKKKARRVSFAEMTSVHFFDRDEEDNETPASETERISGDSADELGFGELLGDNKEFGGEDDGSDDDEETVMPRSFLRPVGSPSPGGSTLGSASSNDEDNFFGPVSANFIRPGRLSDSMASDDNRDVTMDSTTFSMHFRSLVRSDSRVDLKTPTGGHLFFEEKTPTNADNAGSSMVITMGKKPIPIVSTVPMEASSGHYSSDMSIVGETFNKYDYGKLSPRLEALLVESRKDLLSFGVSHDIITSTPPTRKEISHSIDGNDQFISPSDLLRKETVKISSQDVLNGDEPAAHNELDNANVTDGTFHSSHSPQKFSSSALKVVDSMRANNKENRSPYQLSKDESATQLVSFMSPVHQIVLTNATLPKDSVAKSPVAEQSFSLLRNISIENQDIQTSIQKSISKLESLEKSAFASAFSAKVDKSTIRSLDFLKSPKYDSYVEKDNNISDFNEDSFRDANLARVSWSKERRPVLSNVHEATRRQLNTPCAEEPRLQSQVGFPTVSPSSLRKVPDNVQSTKIPLLKFTELSGDTESFSSNKRNIDMLLRGAQKTEIVLLQRSPKIQKGGSWGPQGAMYPSESRTITQASHDRKKWLDTYSKFSEDMKTLLFGVTVELNSKMIDELEDFLACQEKLKRYEMFSLGVMPQGRVALEDSQLEKVAETNALLHQVVFQKAKLLLKHVQKNRLLNRLQLLKSRIHESELLRANIAPKLLETWTSKSKHDVVGDLPLTVDVKKRHKVCQQNLTTMRQELEVLNKKILNLTRALQSHCKMKDEPSCGETIGLVNDQLMKRASCRNLRMDMQMWSVQSVGSSNGHHNVVLNYLDFIIQRIKIIVGPSSSATCPFELNETNILKSFPNMDACSAFAFVFSAETTCKYIGTKTLAQETQKTSSILGSLLDVVGEIQSAQLELQNLTQSNFCSQSVERLDLMLSFFNFNSGTKVTLTLDMSCLNRGIYPSEILPHQMTLSISSQKSPKSNPSLDNIGEALKDVSNGYMRILRLCRCMSQVV